LMVVVVVVITLVSFGLALQIKMKASAAARDLIQRLENSGGANPDKLLCPFLNPANLTAIGYGHLIKYPEEKYLMNRSNCLNDTKIIDKLFDNDIAAVENCLDEMLSNPSLNLTCHQFGGLLSWTYSIGCSSAATSSLVRKLNENATLAPYVVELELNRWVITSGEHFKGLPVRRQKEFTFYNATGTCDRPTDEKSNPN